MLGWHKSHQRCRLFCHFLGIGVAVSTKTLMEGLKFHFWSVKAWPFTQHISDANREFPERNWEWSWALVADDSFSCLATQTKRGSQKPNLQVNTYHGIGAWECSGLCLMKLLPEHQGAFSPSLPVLYFGRSLFPAPSASPSPHPQIHPHCCLEGAQFTQIGNAVIVFHLPLPLFFLCLIILIMTAFPPSLYHQKTKRNSWKTCGVSVFWCTVMGNKIHILRCFSTSVSLLLFHPPQPARQHWRKHECWELVSPPRCCDYRGNILKSRCVKMLTLSCKTFVIVVIGAPLR